MKNFLLILPVVLGFGISSSAESHLLHCGGYLVTVVGHLNDADELVGVNVRYYFDGRLAKPTYVTNDDFVKGLPNENGRIYKDYNVFSLTDGNSFLLPMDVLTKDDSFDTRFNFAPGNDAPGTSAKLTCKVE